MENSNNDYIVVFSGFSGNSWLYNDLIIHKNIGYYLTNERQIRRLGLVHSSEYYKKNYNVRKLTKLEKLIYFGVRE